MILTAPCPRRGRRKPRKARCRRERCNARQRTNADSFNHESNTLSRRQEAAGMFGLVAVSRSALPARSALYLSHRSPSARADLSLEKERLGSGRSPASFLFTGCRGSPLPKEVRNPRRVPHSIDDRDVHYVAAILLRLVRRAATTLDAIEQLFCARADLARMAR